MAVVFACLNVSVCVSWMWTSAKASSSSRAAKAARTNYHPAQEPVDELQAQIEEAMAIHHKDLEEGFYEVYIPEVLARTCPTAVRETGWQWGFPAQGSVP